MQHLLWAWHSLIEWICMFHFLHWKRTFSWILVGLKHTHSKSFKQRLYFILFFPGQISRKPIWHTMAFLLSDPYFHKMPPIWRFHGVSDQHPPSPPLFWGSSEQTGLGDGQSLVEVPTSGTQLSLRSESCWLGCRVDRCSVGMGSLCFMTPNYLDWKYYINGDSVHVK